MAGLRHTLSTPTPPHKLSKKLFPDQDVHNQ